MHNSFQEGLNLYGSQGEGLAFDLHYWLKKSSYKHEDFFELQEDTEVDDSLFIWLVQTRWCSLIPALERIQKKRPVLKKYLLDFLPKDAKENRTKKFLQKNERYQKICLQIQQENKMCTNSIPQVLHLSSQDSCFVHWAERNSPWLWTGSWRMNWLQGKQEKIS